MTSLVAVQRAAVWRIESSQRWQLITTAAGATDREASFNE